eukprot:gene4795-5980_t
MSSDNNNNKSTSNKNEKVKEEASKLFESLKKKPGTNSYQVPNRFSEYFTKKNFSESLDPNNLEQPKFNVSEMYRGFIKMSSYSMGIAASVGLVCFGLYKLFHKKTDLEKKLIDEKKEQHPKKNHQSN